MIYCTISMPLFPKRCRADKLSICIIFEIAWLIILLSTSLAIRIIIIICCWFLVNSEPLGPNTSSNISTSWTYVKTVIDTYLLSKRDCLNKTSALNCLERPVGYYLTICIIDALYAWVVEENGFVLARQRLITLTFTLNLKLLFIK